ncbi:MAG TPA: hypothetical protein VM889_08710 [Candidatus Thermoplasmatota archaeon]|nr:hypothetical protein [Candidatus Thermoplasmatota archaeon]
MKPKALLLLSGGFDSPVAGLVAKEQGLDLEAIHFGLEPFTDRSPEEKALALASKLGVARVHVVEAGVPFSEIASQGSRRLYFVLSKRMMARVASKLAAREGCGWLLTGENLGQVSSQTLANLALIDRAASVPVLRPLLGYDKRDIIEEAHRAGTFEISKGPEMCDVLGPDDPATAAREDEVAAAEARLDLAKLEEACLASIRIVPVTGSI